MSAVALVTAVVFKSTMDGEYEKGVKETRNKN